jgi:hypothetical protein
MTIMTMAFRDLQRGVIPKTQIVHLVDKKSGKSKGLFVPADLEEDVLKILNENEQSLKSKRLKAIDDISGIASGAFGAHGYKESKLEALEEKYGK